MSLKHLKPVLVSAPAVPVVDVVELKSHLRLDHDDEDALLTAYELAATQHLERVTGLAFVNQTWRWDTNTFVDSDGYLRLPKLPVQSITSVQYYASGSYSTVTSSNYRLEEDGLEAYILGVSGFSWPTPDTRNDAIRVTFVAGYGSDGYSVPDPLRHAVMLLVGHWFANRETVNIGNISSVLPFTVDALVSTGYKRMVA